MNITIVDHPSGDWMAIYVNGSILRQGHHSDFDLPDVLNQLGVANTHIVEIGEDTLYGYDGARHYPKNLPTDNS